MHIVDLTELATLYQSLISAETTVLSAEMELDAARNTFTKLQQHLGDMLAATGLSTLTMADGKKIGLVTKYYGSSSQATIDAQKAWLDARGDGAIVKDVFERKKYEINKNSLNAYLRNLAKTEGLDDEVRDLFNVYQVNTVVIE